MGLMGVEMAHAMDDELNDVDLKEENNSPNKPPVNKENEKEMVTEKPGEKKDPNKLCNIL
jgi:hypothetical protein